MENEKWSKSELVEFTVKFNGEAVETNEMDAEELATSLLGMSAVLEEANTVINGQTSRMFVRVRSSFKSGSFDVDMASFFTSVGINALVNIISLVGFTTGFNVKDTLIWLFRQTKGNKILTKKHLPNNKIEINVEKCENPIIVNAEVVNLYENAQVRRGFANVVSPLKNEGISDITFLKNGIECEKILRDERDYFPPLDTETIDKKEDVDYFLITQSNFEGKQTGWRLSFGVSSDKKPDDFPVKILDKDFLNKVKKQEIKISNEGIIIKAKYIKTTQKLERLNVSWEILNVLEIQHESQKHVDKRLDNY